jgi:zinc protease
MSNRSKADKGLPVLVLLLVLGLAPGRELAAQTASAPRAGSAGASPLLPDPSIVQGRLDNGLSYYLKSNDRPRGRVFLRLVVKAGSLEEGEGERGIAHFLEHMAFRGTASFPRDRIEGYMESIGMQFGAEVNAHTDYDSTVYELELPAADADAVATGFRMLRDWADGLLIEEAEVERERGVILAEERLGQGADERVWKKHRPAVYGPSLIARRDPIGLPETIVGIDAAALRRFYTAYYRPELMAVVVAGDLPTAEMARLVTESFAAMPARSGPALAPPGVGERPGLLASAASDPELTSSSLELTVRVPFIRNRTEADFIATGARGVALDLLSDRLQEVLRRAEDRGPSALGAGEMELCEGYDLLDASARFDGASWPEAGAVLLGELARAANYGFSSEELATMRDSYLSSLAAAKHNGYPSATWATRLERVFVKDVIPISIDDRQRLTAALFDSLDPAALGAWPALFLSGSERLVLLSMPASAGPLPELAELGALVTRKPADLGAWRASATREAILPRLPLPTSPERTLRHEGIDAEELVYANGIRVILKTTDFKKDDIVMQALAPRGLDNLDDDAYANAVVASYLVPASGFADLPADALKTLLASKNLSLELALDEPMTVLKGGSDRDGLESLFELVHRTMKDPVIDRGYFAAVKAQVRDSGRNYLSDPGNAFQAFIAARRFPGRPRALMFTRAEDADRLTAEKGLAALKTLVAPTDGLVFCFTGSFDPEVMRGLCDRFLGSLPALEPDLPPPQRSLPADAAMEEGLSAGAAPKASVVLLFTTLASGVDETTVNGLDVLAEGLTRELRDAIRKELGASYDVSAGALTRIESGVSIISVSFDAEPAKAAELLRVAKEGIARLRQEGLSETLLGEITLAMRRDLEVNERLNGWWTGELAFRFLHGREIDPRKALLDSLAAYTTAWTKTAAAAYLDPAHLAVFTLSPAK